MKNVLKNAFTVGAFTALSRVLGLVREMLQARLIGAGVAQSAFTLAFAIPNMFRKLFGEGALTAAFVPVFRGEVEEVGVEKAAKLARAVLTTVMLLLGAITSVALVGILIAKAAVAQGNGSPRAALTLTLVAMLLPYMVAICGAAFGMGVLNALGKFKASSFMPSLLNIIWIAALLSLLVLPCESVETRIVLVAGAILAGGFAQLLFMFVCMSRMKVSPRPTFSGWNSPKVKLVWRNLGIAAFGAGAIQVNYMLDQVLGQIAAPWAAGVIGYAERLMDLPLGIIGVSFGTVLLPTLSGSFARNDADEAKRTLKSSIESLFFFMVPAAFGLAAVAPEMTAVIYEGGEFDALATLRVSRALAVYAAGLAFFGLQKIFVPWFQAQNDMKTPLRVTCATVALNATLNILAVALLPIEWRHVGLAASTVLCAAVACALLFAAARRKNGSLALAGTPKFLAKTVFASLLMIPAIVAFRSYAAGRHSPLVSLVGLVTLGGVVYFFTIIPMVGKAVKSIKHRKAKECPS